MKELFRLCTNPSSNCVLDMYFHVTNLFSSYPEVYSGRHFLSPPFVEEPVFRVPAFGYTLVRIVSARPEHLYVCLGFVYVLLKYIDVLIYLSIPSREFFGLPLRPLADGRVY